MQRYSDAESVLPMARDRAYPLVLHRPRLSAKYHTLFLRAPPGSELVFSAAPQLSALAETRLKPHLGLGVDAASGNRNANGHTLNTFNPLFPNGYYLAGYTGYPNLIHIKPALTVHPMSAVNLRVALASQWRESVADAVSAFPSVPIPKTAGRPGRYTGAYGELRADWRITRHYSASLEAVHYTIGKSIQQAGGHNANFLAIEFRWAW